MTPQEELFAHFFFHEKHLVKDMSELELRAHREEIAKTIFIAKAQLNAIDDEDKDRKKSKRRAEGPSGFERSLNIDETSSDAINKIEERQKKLTKQEKVIEGLVKMGMSQADAEKLVSAGTVLARIKAHPPAPVKNSEVKSDSKNTIVNPFTKKEV